MITDDGPVDDDWLEIGDARFLPGRGPALPAGEEALPASWWGAVRPRPPVRHLPELVASGMLTAAEAAWLWCAVEAGVSLVVCAGPSGAGKSTLLTALLAAVAEQRALRYALGPVDPLRRDPGLAPAATAIAIPEISPHLPGYVWGPGLGRLLALRSAGAQLLATAHASDPADFLRQVGVYPNSIAPRQAAAFDLLAFLEPGGGATPSHLARLVTLIADGEACLAHDLPADGVTGYGTDWLNGRNPVIASHHSGDISHYVSAFEATQTALPGDPRAAGRALRRLVRG